MRPEETPAAPAARGERDAGAVRLPRTHPDAPSRTRRRRLKRWITERRWAGWLPITRRHRDALNARIDRLDKEHKTDFQAMFKQQGRLDDRLEDTAEVLALVRAQPEALVFAEILHRLDRLEARAESFYEEQQRQWLVFLAEMREASREFGHASTRVRVLTDRMLEAGG